MEGGSEELVPQTRGEIAEDMMSIDIRLGSMAHVQILIDVNAGGGVPAKKGPGDIPPRDVFLGASVPVLVSDPS